MPHLEKKAVLHYPKIFYDYDWYNKVKRKNSNPAHCLITSGYQFSSSIFFTGKPCQQFILSQTRLRYKATECFTVLLNTSYPVRTVDKEATVEHRYVYLTGRIRDKYGGKKRGCNQCWNLQKKNQKNEVAYQLQLQFQSISINFTRR